MSGGEQIEEKSVLQPFDSFQKYRINLYDCVQVNSGADGIIYRTSILQPGALEPTEVFVKAHWQMEATKDPEWLNYLKDEYITAVEVAGFLGSRDMGPQVVGTVDLKENVPGYIMEIVPALPPMVAPEFVTESTIDSLLRYRDEIWNNGIVAAGGVEIIVTPEGKPYIVDAANFELAKKLMISDNWTREKCYKENIDSFDRVAKDLHTFLDIDKKNTKDTRPKRVLPTDKDYKLVGPDVHFTRLTGVIFALRRTFARKGVGYPI